MFYSNEYFTLTYKKQRLDLYRIYKNNFYLIKSSKNLNESNSGTSNKALTKKKPAEFLRYK